MLRVPRLSGYPARRTTRILVLRIQESLICNTPVGCLSTQGANLTTSRSHREHNARTIPRHDIM